MCGIAALVDPASATPPDIAPRLADALRHRGPDGEACVRVDPALLVHTRLAIIDVAGGEQPLYSEDRRCAVIVNGEIYNHLDLRRKLEDCGHRFATRSDSEVIVHAYEEWDLDCVRRLNGMFAFAIWDDRRSRLIAARDPFGIKPLYWFSDGRRTALASEVRALLRGGLVQPRVDPVALDHFLAWRFVPAPRTLFAGVSKLPPGSVLVLEEHGRPELRSFREPPGTPFSDAAPEELARELRSGLVAAVQRQMMSDVPYGAFLSGGVDSAAIVAAMALSNEPPLRTFTIGFPGHGTEMDERAAARATATELGSLHRDVAMAEGDFPAEVARCIGHLEEPCGASSAPAALRLSRFAVESVKVVLSGQGADEPLGGYQRHQAAAALPALARLPSFTAAPARKAAGALPGNERLRRAAALLAAPAGIDRLLTIFDVTPAHIRASLTGCSGEEAASERRALASALLLDIGDREDPLEQALYLDTHLVLPDSLLTYGDKMSMAVSLEQRVPFLDVELMRFVERIPARFRLHRLKRKWLYRRALVGLVPDGALARRKGPFPTPYDERRSGLGERVAQEYADPELAAVVGSQAVARLVGEHADGRLDHNRILYCLLELAMWHRIFVQGRQQPASDAARDLAD